VPARLIPLDSGRRREAIPLERGEIVIGRDPSADVLIDAARVSRRHAALRARGSRHTLQDLGSSNGTRVNGVDVREPVLLQDGDAIELGGDITILYETGEPGRWQSFALAAAAGVLALAAIAGAVYWFLGREDPVWTEATRLAAEGVAASRAGDTDAAKARLRSAAGVLYKHGHLDDVERADVMRVAMQRLGERLEEPVDLVAIFEASLETSWKKPALDVAPVGCLLDRVAPSELPGCLSERIELVLIGLRQDPKGVPKDYQRQVGTQMRRERDFIEGALRRGDSLIPMLRRELEAAKMPPMLHYLALIESGYRIDATSPAKAVGLWQFMPGTAKQYGLSVGGPHDDRMDRSKSTRAAARYLRDLAFEFGGDALLLALAGYNRGENGVRAALKKLEDPFSDRSYWKLVEEGLLPEETALYVTRFIAAAAAGEGGLPSDSALERAGY
jgi:hypothetical protein